MPQKRSEPKNYEATNSEATSNADEDRRRHLRADFRLKARYLDPNGREHACVVVNISAGGAMVKAKKAPQAGDRIVLYVDGVGRFESTVVRSGRHAFAVRYHSRRAKTQRTADALIRVLNRGQRESDRRIAPRIAMNQPVVVTHEDGSHVECGILDVSLTGASLAMDPQPPLGTEMIVGRMKARVVRRHELGVGVIFLGSMDRMEDVIEQASQDLNNDENFASSGNNDRAGTLIAPSFGRKTTDE